MFLILVIGNGRYASINNYKKVSIMRWKNMNNTVAVLLIIMSLIYIFDINYSASQAILFMSNGVGPTYFPNALASIVIFLCIVVLIKDNRKIIIDTVIEIPNYKYIVFTVVLTVVFLLSWQFLGSFYINVFCFLATLLFFYRDGSALKRMGVALSTSFFTTIFIYLLFSKLLSLSL